MIPPEPTPELLAAARRIEAREWTLDADDDYSPHADACLHQLHKYGFVWLHFAAASRLQEGTDQDRWVLTAAGKEWLDRHDRDDDVFDDEEYR